MLLKRWKGEKTPTKEQIEKVFQRERLEFYLEEHAPGEKIKEHAHPFDEVRMVYSGTLLMNVGGNQLLLCPGDRIEIPSNTRHSHSTHSEKECLCICAQRPF